MNCSKMENNQICIVKFRTFQSNLYCTTSTVKTLFRNDGQFIILVYYTTNYKTVRGRITKVNQSECSIAEAIFSKYWTGHCPG